MKFPKKKHYEKIRFLCRRRKKNTQKIIELVGTNANEFEANDLCLSCITWIVEQPEQPTMNYLCISIYLSVSVKMIFSLVLKSQRRLYVFICVAFFSVFLLSVFPIGLNFCLYEYANTHTMPDLWMYNGIIHSTQIVQCLSYIKSARNFLELLYSLSNTSKKKRKTKTKNLQYNQIQKLNIVDNKYVLYLR